MKGEGLPITYLVIILLAVIVAIAVILFWTGGFAGLTEIWKQQEPGEETLKDIAIANLRRECVNWKNNGCVTIEPSVDIPDEGTQQCDYVGIEPC